MRQRVVVFVLGLLLCGCAMMTALSVVHVFSPRELNADPEQYDGREVVVRGFVVLGTNGRSLYESKERFEEWSRAFDTQAPGFNASDFDADCLTLLNADVVEDNFSVFDGQTITVRGRFESKYLTGNVVDLQACHEPTALVLDERDARRVLRDLRHAH